MARAGTSTLLYDGACGLCHGAVRFIRARDAATLFSFIPLQSEQGQELLKAHGLPQDYITSMVLVEQGQAHRLSDAALRVARKLPGGWRLLWHLRLVPRPLRDAVYRLVARFRRRWPGGDAASCELPRA